MTLYMISIDDEGREHIPPHLPQSEEEEAKAKGGGLKTRITSL
jgi:hypothetical protein